VRAERLGDRTVLTRVDRTAPFHLGPVSYRSGHAEVIVQQVGPGLFPGDDLVVEVDIAPGAELTLRGQAATKVYPCPPGARSQQRTLLRVDAGGRLRVFPGELIPFRDASYHQQTDVELASGARCALAEVVGPGRSAMGERDAYRRLDLHLRLRVDGRPVLIERSRLEPAHYRLDVPGRHGATPWVGVLIVAGYGGVDLTPPPAGDPVWWGAGRTAQGDVQMVRLLGPTAQGIRLAIRRLLHEIEQGGVADRNRCRGMR
jgi:urease accessory protein UreH